LAKAGGDGGIRTLDRALQPYNGLANRRLQPLGHISEGLDMPDAMASRKHQIACSRIIAHGFGPDWAPSGLRLARSIGDLNFGQMDVVSRAILRIFEDRRRLHRLGALIVSLLHEIGRSKNPHTKQ
jgi:hypothetical protein